MKTFAIVATDKRTNEIIFAEGVEDSSEKISASIPRSVFTPEEVEQLSNDELCFHASHWNRNPDSDVFWIDCVTGYSLTCNLTNIKIETVEVDVTPDTILESTDYENSKEISVLTILENKTGAVLFAEGTDEDGYRHHQVSLGDNQHLVSNSEKDSSDEFLLQALMGNDIEAKDICGDYENITITMKRVLVS